MGRKKENDNENENEEEKEEEKYTRIISVLRLSTSIRGMVYY